MNGGWGRRFGGEMTGRVGEKVGRVFAKNGEAKNGMGKGRTGDGIDKGWQCGRKVME